MLIVPPPDAGTVTGVASIIAGFGAAMLFFRVQREIAMAEAGEINWIPWADRLLIGSTTISLLLVVLPVLLVEPTTFAYAALPPAACACAAILLAGYPFALLAHYRFILGGGRTGPRDNPEPAERYIVITTILVAVAVFAYGIWLRSV